MPDQDWFPPVSPGEILREEFLEPLGITPYRLARDVHVTPTRIHEILNAKRSISADTAQRLGRYFGTTAAFWLNMQTRYDLDCLRESGAGAIDEIDPLQRPTPKELTAA